MHVECASFHRPTRWALPHAMHSSGSPQDAALVPSVSAFLHPLSSFYAAWLSSAGSMPSPGHHTVCCAPSRQPAPVLTRFLPCLSPSCHTTVSDGDSERGTAWLVSPARGRSCAPQTARLLRHSLLACCSDGRQCRAYICKTAGLQSCPSSSSPHKLCPRDVAWLSAGPDVGMLSAPGTAALGVAMSTCWIKLPASSWRAHISAYSPPRCSSWEWDPCSATAPPSRTTIRSASAMVESLWATITVVQHCRKPARESCTQPCGEQASSFVGEESAWAQKHMPRGVLSTGTTSPQHRLRPESCAP